MSKDLADREKLAYAFDELKQIGYDAPIEFAWEQCCSSCGWGMLDNPEKAVFWNVQSDDNAFFGGAGIPIPDEFLDLDDEEMEEMYGSPTYEAAELVMRLDHKVLVNDLYLQWSGDSEEICDVLVKWGLSVERPISSAQSIKILGGNNVR